MQPCKWCWITDLLILSNEFYRILYAGLQCKGQATSFVDAEYYDKLNICTGQFGMFAKAKKAEGKFVAGKFCKGKSLGAFFLDNDDKGQDAAVAGAQAN